MPKVLTFVHKFRSLEVLTFIDERVYVLLISYVQLTCGQYVQALIVLVPIYV